MSLFVKSTLLRSYAKPRPMVLPSDLCRKYDIAEQTVSRWRNDQYNGMTVPEARRLKDPAAEDATLERLRSEQLLAIEGPR